MSIAMNGVCSNIEDMTKTGEQFDTVIVGLGKTGMSCVRYLSGQGRPFVVIDSRSEPPELESLRQRYPDVLCFLGSLDEDILSAARHIIVSPGVALTEPAITAAAARGATIIGDIELFCLQATVPIIAITGSNGKSTVASMLHEMILRSGKRSGLGGNIGTPALDLFSTDAPDFYVLELSSFQLEAVYSLNSVAAVMLNVTEDHMDRYHDINGYAQAKEKVYGGDGVMVINLDDKFVAGVEIRDRKSITYSLCESSAGVFGIRTVNGERFLAYGTELLLPASALQIHGDHNLSNALAVLALGTAIDLPMSSMLDSLKVFAGLPHRCQWLARIDGVDWYNDSKGTNVGASCAAINGLATAGDLILIAGGVAKDADFSQLAETVRQHVRTVILIGRDANVLAAALAGTCRIYSAMSIDAAVHLAAELADEGASVLLSPACASFDMFADYQARGEAFSQAVSSLQKGHG